MIYIGQSDYGIGDLKPYYLKPWINKDYTPIPTSLTSGA